MAMLEGFLQRKGQLTQKRFCDALHCIAKISKQVAEIVRTASKADSIILATDPDREGEAISWHIYELLKEKKRL